MKVDWESLGKRLIAANNIGIRIEQDSGHRWIICDRDADFWQNICTDQGRVIKEYGSYTTALDYIDAELKAKGKDSLLEIFNNIDHYNDLGVVFGDSVQ